MKITDGTIPAHSIPIPILIPLTVVRFRFRFNSDYDSAHLEKVPIPIPIPESPHLWSKWYWIVVLLKILTLEDLQVLVVLYKSVLHKKLGPYKNNICEDNYNRALKDQFLTAFHSLPHMNFPVIA